MRWIFGLIFHTLLALLILVEFGFLAKSMTLFWVCVALAMMTL